MTSSPYQRVALLGLSLECNRFAPNTTRDDFLARLYMAGDEILDELVSVHSRLPPEVQGFRSAMDRNCAWTPVPVLIAQCESGGPLEHAFFEETLAEMTRRLRAEMPLDGVYIVNHGALVTTACNDPDGEMFSAIREAVGLDIPIVSTLDLHANVSARMVDNVDVIIGYKTNPHVDMFERGSDAAHALLSLWREAKTFPAHVKLPLMAPTVCLSTLKGPYAELWQLAEELEATDDDVTNISLFGGFALSDTEKNGLSVLVNSRRSPEHAMKVATQLARTAWADRPRYVPQLSTIEVAINMARSACSQPRGERLLLADVADNPGGGGSGNTTVLISALLEADIPDVLVGLFHDPELAANACQQGLGSQIQVRFKSFVGDQVQTHTATVLKVSDGDCVGRRGLYSGRRMNLGQSALITIQGIRIAVVSHRTQCADPAFLEMFGEDLSKVSVVVLKSRGHFRAGFDEFFSDQQILEVDTPGLTSPVLSRFKFEHVTRPIFPLDPI